ncbi:MAG: 2Fe-2S iron-sulfur cluster binding domain-containing protein [Methylococcales bacterium]|nr:2Fe-2S iron-sulfur cluster binding domain-containing protein [Methylococcales bacterium]
MTKIIYQGNEYPSLKNETVLDTFLRNGIKTQFSCRNGVCHVCMLRTTQGTVPQESQEGLKTNMAEKNYFLACKCIPESDIEVAQPRPADIFNRVVVYKKEMLAPDICRLLLESATELYYHAGQFISLRRNDGLLRSYSLASVPYLDVHLELHVKRIANGKMSNWIFDELQEGDDLEFQGADGNSYYTAEKPKQNILMVGTGTGLAPLVGIIRDALISNHKGEIYLYQGCRHQQDIYLQDTLRELTEQHSNFHYTQCVSAGDVPEGCVAGRASQIAMTAHPDLKGWCVYLCGTPGMVYSMKENAKTLGVDPAEIHIDPFELSHSFESNVTDTLKKKPALKASNSKEQQPERRNYPEPDPEMWAALEEGKLLTVILDDFYTRVYQDHLLNPYFEDVTKEWVAQKQYSFLRQVFTGEKVYLGNRPRNAHHWMVISDELFDYRESIILDCLRRYGIAEHLVKRWQQMEERYRDEIVKSKPWNKIVNGKEVPVEGFEEIKLEIAGVCDNCLQAIEAGELIRYHVRLASVYCPSCMDKI